MICQEVVSTTEEKQRNIKRERKIGWYNRDRDAGGRKEGGR